MWSNRYMGRICVRCVAKDSRPTDLGDLDPAFAGFQLVDGQIVTPNGYSYPPGFLYAIPIRLQQVSELQRELATPRQLML